MPGWNSQTWGTARTLPNSLFVLFYVLFVFVLLYILFVCKCVLYYCHRVSTELQLTNISFHLIYYRYTFYCTSCTERYKMLHIIVYAYSFIHSVYWISRCLQAAHILPNLYVAQKRPSRPGVDAVQFTYSLFALKNALCRSAFHIM